jgi:gliding motility-associated-like protein
MKVLPFIFFFFVALENISAQTYVFAQLTGSPNLNTTGWNLTGNAFVGDTGGDVDANSNELILTNALGNQSGGVFFGTPINPLICSKWTVEFDYRIWGGSAADGLAFCFLDVPPAGFVNGGGVGIPGTANGLKVILDTWNNCGGPNPEIQIYSGVGYNECIAGIVKVDNSSNTLGFVRSNNYQPVKITYVNGVVTVFINNIQYLTANFPINFSGYMGFTASTGGATDQQSIRNAIIYTDQATSNAGIDASFCTGENATIGTSPNANFIYSWSPSTGLSDPAVSNPTVTLTNNGSIPITQTYTVTTSLASSPGICPTTDQINVTVYPQFNTSLNISICDGDTYAFNGQNLTTSGTYQASLLSVNGCDSIVNLILNVNPLSNVIIDTSICQGTSFTIGGQNLVNSGQYTFTFQNQNGCDSVVVLNLNVFQLPSITSTSATVCSGETAILIPSGAQNYTWSPTIGSVDSQGVLTVSVVSTTNFNLTGTDVNGCVNTILVPVYVNPLPNIQLNSDQTQYCVGDAAQLNASGGISYFWDQFSGNIGSQVFTAQSSSYYTVTGVDANNCSAVDSVFVLVNENPILSITPNQEICLGEVALIAVSGANSFSWSPFGSGTQSYFTPNSTTVYTVIGTDINNCTSQISTIVVVNPRPTANLTANPLISTADSPNITFENNSIGDDLLVFSTGDGTTYDQFDSSLEYAYPFSEGNYMASLWVQNQFGCSDSTQLVIQIKGDEIFYVPNTFTPDGDEHNHIFSPVFTTGFDPANFQFDLFNRWGELIFQSLNADKGWDGFYNGLLCPEGTYVWKITYKIPDRDEYKIVTGHVNLIR